MQLKHTDKRFKSLQILHIIKVFKSHFQSSQVFYELPVAVT
jgi:hypothetical protein